MLIYLQMIETEEDRTKFEIPYSEYKEWMFHIAQSILHNTQDAEDGSYMNISKTITMEYRLGYIKSLSEQNVSLY